MSPIGQQFLYPPSIASYMPAFLSTEVCRVYFSLTSYNNPAAIKHAQVALSFMNTNLSALKRAAIGGWPNGYKLCPIHLDNTITTEYKYYIEINPAVDLQDATFFSINQYYKVQIRLSSVNPLGTPLDGGGLPIFASDPGAMWYADNIAEFSEWSTVCLLKAISDPYVFILGLMPLGDRFIAGMYDTMDASADPGFQVLTASAFESMALNATTFDSGNTLLALVEATNLFTGEDTGHGSMVFSGQYSNPDTSEVLSSYSAALYKILPNESLQFISDTGIKYPDMTYQNGNQYEFSGEDLQRYSEPTRIFNSFHFNFDTILDDAQNYQLDLTYKTKNGYSNVITYNFKTAFSTLELEDITSELATDEENGRIGVQVTSQVYTDELDRYGAAIPKAVRTTGTLIIYRSDHRTNFTVWKTIYDREVDNEILDETIYDYTAESGIFYKYAVNGKILPAPVITSYEDIFLRGEAKQLKIQFNPQISSFKYIVQDNKVETLGGKYPFVTRNGNVKYREISIGGLISALTDENNLFVTDAELYDGLPEIFSLYNEGKRISPYNDVIREQKFRERVLDFLYDGKVKLFKSGPEGNILVKVTDVSLTPIDTLGRMLYSFSATLTEVDEFSLEVCKKYSISLSDAYSDLIYMIAINAIGDDLGRDTIFPYLWSEPETVSEAASVGGARERDIVYLYCRSIDPPISPLVKVRWNFMTKIGTVSGDSPWSLTIPASNGDPLYYISVKLTNIYSKEYVDILPREWSAPVKHYLKAVTLCLYKADSATPMPADLTYKLFSNNISASSFDGFASWNATALDSFTIDNPDTLERESTLTAYQFDSGALYSYLTPANGTFEINDSDLVGVKNGWSLIKPTGATTLYGTFVTIITNEDAVEIPAASWSPAATLAKTGETVTDFNKVDKVFLYKEAAANTIPAAPSSALTYTFSNTTVTGTLNGWSQTPPINTNPLYVIGAVAYGSGLTASIAVNKWSKPMLIAPFKPSLIKTIYLYKKQEGRTVAPPRTPLNYSFEADTLEGVLDGWLPYYPLTEL